MKKIITIALTLFMATNVFAQEIVEVVDVKWNTRDKESLLGPYDGSYVYLSNGQYLRYVLRFRKKQGGNYTHNYWILFTKGESGFERVDFPVTLGDKNLVGQKFEKKGDTFFTPIKLQKVGTYIIKKVSVHEVTSEFTASMNGDYSYKWAHVLIAGGGKAKGSVSGSAKGGPRTIVNIFFENGKKTTIEASEDPIWLDAEPGMQAEHYRFGDKNFYNLL